ncbi:MAG: PilZ domain-containing protein [Pyrinomonadaceae bacterium]
MPPDQNEKRRIKRVSISLPVRIAGKNSDLTDWHEMSRTIDVSSYGAGFLLEHEVERGQLLKLTLPMPQQLRSFDFMGTHYNVWGIVTGCGKNSKDENKSLVGTAFIGNNPPHSYIQNPGQLYQIQFDNDDGSYRLKPTEKIIENASRPEVYRQHSRYDIPISVTIEILDPGGNVLKRESTVMENVSLGGAAIFSSLEPEIGSELQVRSDQYNANLKAVLRGKRKGEDGIPRLHVEFIDGLFPLSGIDIEF